MVLRVDEGIDTVNVNESHDRGGNDGEECHICAA